MNISREFSDESIMLKRIAKWMLLATILGSVVGGLTGCFIKLVNWGFSNTSKISNFYFLMPLAFFLSSFIILKLAPDAEGHGTEKAIEAYHRKNGKVNLKVIPVKIITTFITISAGGSVGQEGPSTQIGAGIASLFSDLFKLEAVDRRIFAVCGISAGFAGVLGVPISSAVFAVEVLYIGKFSYSMLLPALIASFSSSFVVDAMGIKPHAFHISSIPERSITSLLSMVIFGLIIGLIAIIFIKILNGIEKFFEELKLYKPLKGIIGGAIAAFIIYITGSLNVLGTGGGILEAGVSGEKLPLFDFFIKILITSITLGSGGSGGLLMPTLFIGTAFGNTWAQLFGGSISLYSAAGMVAFLGACCNTPIAALLLGMEFFGRGAGMYAAIVCVVSYLIAGHRSVYPTQIVAESKSIMIDIEKDCEIGSL